MAGYTHPKSGVAAGTYNSVTVNDEGHVTAGSTVAVVKKVNNAEPDADGNVTVDLGVTSVNGNSGAVELYTAGTDDLTAGESALETGKLYFMYE